MSSRRPLGNVNNFNSNTIKISELELLYQFLEIDRDAQKDYQVVKDAFDKAKASWQMRSIGRHPQHQQASNLDSGSYRRLLTILELLVFNDKEATAVLRAPQKPVPPTKPSETQRPQQPNILQELDEIIDDDTSDAPSYLSRLWSLLPGGKTGLDRDAIVFIMEFDRYLTRLSEQ